MFLKRNLGRARWHIWPRSHDRSFFLAGNLFITDKYLRVCVYWRGLLTFFFLTVFAVHFHFPRVETGSVAWLQPEWLRMRLTQQPVVIEWIDTLNAAKLIVLRENQLCKTPTRHRKNLKQSGVVAVDSCFAIILVANQHGATNRQALLKNIPTFCFRARRHLSPVLTASRHITCPREGKSPSVALISRKENIGWTKPTLEIWAKPCKNEQHMGYGVHFYVLRHIGLRSFAV